jgi:EAL domain-containing protein (putative c-di-GMP-specific phosphodiesterase class I)
MLKNMHADVLKIDMGFLRETQNHKRTQIILNTIIELAKQLHMTVITEGVETEKQVSFLRDADCDIFQGYYFSRPVSVADFEKKYFDDDEETEDRTAVIG